MKNIFIMCNWFIGDILLVVKLMLSLKENINHNYIQLKNLFVA